jgi:hypothetical protein
MFDPWVAAGLWTSGDGDAVDVDVGVGGVAPGVPATRTFSSPRRVGTDVSIAERTREAVRDHPFLVDALRAGVVNHAAAAAFLDVDGDPESVATALRRYAASLNDADSAGRDARVTVERGVAVADGAGVDDPPALRVGGVAVVPGGDATAIRATGDVDAAALGAVLARLRVEGVAVEAAGVADGSLVVVVGRRGARAVADVEAALAGGLHPTN